LYHLALAEIHLGLFSDAETNLRKGAKKARTMRIEFKGAEDSLAQARIDAEKAIATGQTGAPPKNGENGHGKSGSNGVAVSIDDLKAKIAANPRDQIAVFALSKAYFDRAMYTEAKAQLDLSLGINGGHELTHYLVGRVDLAQGRYADAEALFAKKLKQTDKFAAEFNNGLGLVRLAKSRDAKLQGIDSLAFELAGAADEYFRAAIQSSPNSAEYHLNLGDANFLRGVYATARAEYEIAMVAGPLKAEALMNYAEACFKIRDYQCALTQAQNVIILDSANAQAWRISGTISYGAAKAATGDAAVAQFNNAIASHRKYIELTGATPDSQNALVFIELAMALNTRGGYEEALTHFRNVVAIPVESRDIYAHMGRAFGGLKEFDSAVTYFEKHKIWLTSQPADFKSTLTAGELDGMVGEMLYSKGDHAAAIPYLEIAYAADSTRQETALQLALAHHNLKEYRAALPYYKKRIAAGLGERGWPVFLNGAYCAVAVAEGEGVAAPVVDETTAVTPADPLDAVAPSDYYKLATEWLEKVVEYKPDNDKAISLLATTYLYDLNDCENGVKWFSSAIERNPNDCEALRSLGYAYFGGVCVKNFDRAIHYLTQAYNCSGGSCKSSQIMLWLGQAHHLRAASLTEQKRKDEAKVDYQKAHEWYGKVLACEPGNAEAQQGKNQVQFEF